MVIFVTISCQHRSLKKFLNRRRIKTEWEEVNIMYWISGLIGLAAIVAPYYFGYTDQNLIYWGSVGFGGIMLALTVFEFIDQDKGQWEYWVAALLGVGAIIAPFVFGFSSLTQALWTSLILGAVTLVVSGTKLFSQNEFT